MRDTTTKPGADRLEQEAGELAGVVNSPSHFSWTPALLQLTDPALPIGAYAHSMGLEGLVQEGHINSSEALLEFLQRDVLASAQELDLPLIRLARQAFRDRDWKELAKLDTLAWASRQSAELRAASSKMGRQLISLADSLLPEGRDGTQAPRQRFDQGQEHLPHRQNLTVLALYYEIQDIPLEPCLAGYLWQILSGFAQAGLKLLHLGPIGIQKSLSAVLPLLDEVVQRSLRVRAEEVGGFFPLWDASSARHEWAEARLFIS